MTYIVYTYIRTYLYVFYIVVDNHTDDIDKSINVLLVCHLLNVHFHFLPFHMTQRKYIYTLMYMYIYTYTPLYHNAIASADTGRSQH